jgi:hypothetical protein
MNVVVLQLKLLKPEELMILANIFKMSALQVDAAFEAVRNPDTPTLSRLQSRGILITESISVRQFFSLRRADVFAGPHAVTKNSSVIFSPFREA